MMNTLDLFYKYTSKKLDKNTYLENFVAIFLVLLKTYKENFYKSFENEIYSIYADIISFINNPQCSCRVKIAAYVESNYFEIYRLVEDWFKNYNDHNDKDNHKILLEFFDRLQEKNDKNKKFEQFQGEPSEAIGNYMLGKVVTISDTPEEFNKLIIYLKENDYYYNHMSVVKDDNNQIKIYFA